VAAVHVVLRRRRFASPSLVAADVGTALLALVSLVAVYALGYEAGPWRVIPVLVLVILARAVLFPSTMRRTLLVSLVAPLGIGACQAAQGRVFVAEGVSYAGGGFWWAFVWDQAILWTAVGVAAVLSRMSYALRLEAFEARRLGQYVIERKIGEGSMGEVYLATHALLKRPTAIKLLRPELASKETIRRFEHEVRQSCRLAHPNTISIYDFGHTPDGVFFYAMELLDGEDLGEIVSRTGPMPPGRAIHVLMQACGALAEAHGKGLVHRDVKPKNLLLCVQGGEHDFVKLVDFGLVKDLRGAPASATLAGSVCGTPETIAPEAISGGPVGPAADIYALGVVGYFLLTGKGIFDASTALEYIAHHLRSDPIPPSARDPNVPKDLEAAMLRCLAKDPASRPASAEELRDALRSCRDAGTWRREDAAAWWRGFRGAARSP
jgi:serine/threonine-protein kinase